jgi:hypothetical protein
MGIFKRTFTPLLVRRISIETYDVWADRLCPTDAVNVYVQPGPKAMRYTRLASDAVDDIAASLVYEFTFLATGKSAAQPSTGATAGVKRKSTAKKGTPGASKKRVKGRGRTSETPDSDFDFEVEQMALEEFELYG